MQELWKKDYTYTFNVHIWTRRMHCRFPLSFILGAKIRHFAMCLRL